MPSLASATYAVRGPLAAWLRAEAQELHERFERQYRVLDVGCGQKPYYPFFAPYASEYVGVDAPANRLADLHGRVEDLPVGDESFDVVLCTQVLEHCDDPAQAVRELYRVTRPGGRVLASTHGVQVYHPSPVDYWRWTHAGLARLFATHAPWDNVDVIPASGTTACVGMILAMYLDLLAKRAHVRPLIRPMIATLNVAARWTDARIPALRDPRPGTLFANLHVTADR